MSPFTSSTFCQRWLPMGAAALLLLTACGGPDSSPESSAAADTYPTGHIHGMTVDKGTDRILLATHDGLFDVSRSPAARIGPAIDLMGFTTTANGEFLASGHPHPGTEMPDPVGLIRSTDAGHTWEPLSRQGESDFHALTTARNNIVGFDGQLLISEDGGEWFESQSPLQPFNLSGTSQSNTVLATTEGGLQRSTDAGQTWNSLPETPLLLLTSLKGSAAAGISSDGRIHTSADAGSTWTERGEVSGQPAAMDTHETSEGALEIWVATDAGVMVSNDGGDTFTTIVSATGD